MTTALIAEDEPLLAAGLRADLARLWPDLQVVASYPASEARWDAGDLYYYCFVSLESGQPLTGTSLPAGTIGGAACSTTFQAMPSQGAQDGTT